MIVLGFIICVLGAVVLDFKTRSRNVVVSVATQNTIYRGHV